MSGTIYLEFTAAEQAGQAMIREAQNLDRAAQTLFHARDALYASGLQGALARAFDERCQEILNTFRTLNDEYDEAGRDLLTVVQWARELDAEGASRFAESGYAGAAAHSNISAIHYDGYTSSYGLGNAAWDLSDLISQLWLRAGAGDVAAKALLKELGLNAAPGAVPFLGGFISGLMDYQLEYGDGPFNGAAFATEVSSGVLQAAVSLTGVGSAVMLGNTVVQLTGHALTIGVYQGADLMAGGDPALADIYRRQANDLNKALDAGNLDNAFDAVTGNIIDMFTNNGSVEQNLGEMAKGVGGTLSGVGQILFEAKSMESVTALGTAKRGTNALMDSLHVDENYQQAVNQSIDMAMQDIQDLDLADLPSFQRVAERRINYFRNTFGI